MPIKDLSQVVQEPLTLKLNDDIQFTIPMEPTLELTYKIVDYEDKMANAKTGKEQLDLIVEIVTTILKQDTSQNVTPAFIKKHFTMKSMLAVIEIYQNQIIANQKNPN